MGTTVPWSPVRRCPLPRPPVRQFYVTTRFLLIAIPLLALLPAGKVAWDWSSVNRLVPGQPLEASVQSYDGVEWGDRDGQIVAQYVFPEGPAAAASMRAGDIFLTLEDVQFFSPADLEDAIGSTPPGTRLTYLLNRDGRPVEASVRLARYPTFLYPRSDFLWQFALWGFTLGAFFHVLGLIIAGPLAVRSRTARFSLGLIAISFLWIGGNMLRVWAFEFAGPAYPDTAYGQLFRTLTLLGLAGWIAFPALLVHKLVRDTEPARLRTGWWQVPVYLPPVVLGLAVVWTSLHGPLGPLALGGLIAPILFYVSCYVGLAAAIVLAVYVFLPREADTLVSGWGRTGGIVTLVLAAVTALAVQDVLPVFGALSKTTAGWIVVSAQLLSVVPVTFVSLSTLQHGKIDQVLSRAIAYVGGLGLLFFAFVGGFSLIDPVLARLELSRTVGAGIYVVVLLFLFDRLARRLRPLTASLFTTDRQRIRQTLIRFQEQMRNILDLPTLLQQTIQVTAEAFTSRSAVLYIRPHPEAPWVSSRYHPEPPYLTERVVHQVWPHVEREGRIWAHNPELNESRLPEKHAAALRERGAALVVPIMGEGAPMGVIILGPKRERRAVYNLADLDLLRSLGGQLALAVERLSLVEREKALVRETAEAQLAALRAQINPHFLFNALNTVMALIDERPSEAEAIVENLAVIFRYILTTSSRTFVTLDEELTLVNRYLAIEQARFGDKLDVERTVDPALRSFPVPAFAVQTLVENAVKHGLEKSRDGGRVRLAAQLRPDGLAEIVVEDTGVGIPALFDVEAPSAAGAFFGIGLRNVASRLEQLYGRADLLHLASAPGVGTTATLWLPRHREEAGRDGTPAAAETPQEPA